MEEKKLEFLEKFLQQHENTMKKFSENVMKEAGKIEGAFQQEADQFVSQQVKGILCGSVPIPISYEDSDQSPVSGATGEFVKNIWAYSMDYVPYNPMYFHLSDWLKTIWSGDYEGFLKILENNQAEELDCMLKKRETLLNIGAIFHVVIGARTVGVGNCTSKSVLDQANATLNVKNEQMKILIKLLSLDVDVNVHDFAGFTPLHHCFTCYGTELTFKMGERILKAGANVNAPNRLGETSLLTISKTNNYTAMTLLLEYGADPYFKDNYGFSAHLITRINPKSQKLFVKYYKKNMKKAMKDDSYESQSKCGNCGESNKYTSKCSGCYFVWYCSQACQKSQWPQHKDQCKKTKGQYKIANYVSEYVTAYSPRPNIAAPQDINKNLKKTHFVVKVQVLLGPVRSSDEFLCIYNKDKSFFFPLVKREQQRSLWPVGGENHQRRI